LQKHVFSPLTHISDFKGLHNNGEVYGAEKPVKAAYRIPDTWSKTSYLRNFLSNYLKDKLKQSTER